MFDYDKEIYIATFAFLRLAARQHKIKFMVNTKGAQTLSIGNNDKIELFYLVNLYEKL